MLESLSNLRYVARDEKQQLEVTAASGVLPEFGERVALAPLLEEPVEYGARVKRLRKLDALYTGGDALAPYVPELIGRKFQEDAQLWQRRVDMFEYHNHVQASIKELANKFATGTYTVAGDSMYRALDVGKGFMVDLLKRAMRLGVVYVVAEPLLTTPIRSNVQRQALMRKFEALPKPLSVYSPFECIVATRDYYKFRVQESVTDGAKMYYRVHLRYITASTFYTMSYEYDGSSGYREVGASEFTNKSEVSLTPARYINTTGRMPVFELRLPDDTFVAQQLMPLQVQYTRIWNAIITNSHAAGHMQPWYTPLPDGDALPEELRPKKTGSDYTIAAQRFDIAETTGASTKGQLEVLDNILVNIKQTVGLSGLSYSAAASDMSGYSKEFELHALEANMRAYGELMTSFYQRVLSHVGSQLGAAPCNVSGFDTFSLDSAKNTLHLFKLIKDAGVELPQRDRDRLIAKLCAQLDPNDDA